jgi:hypothetical protein
MQNAAYIIFVLCAAVLGALLGIAAHFWRANAAYVPEKLFDDGDIANGLFMDNYLAEKYIVGAEWDDNGYWSSGSVRNLLYYMISGFVAPLAAGLIFWSERVKILEGICKGIAYFGLNSPLC